MEKDVLSIAQSTEATKRLRNLTAQKEKSPHCENDHNDKRKMGGEGWELAL